MINKIHEIIWKLRPVPVVFSALFAYVIYDAWEWYKALPKADRPGDIFIIGLLGPAAAWFKFYTSSGRPPEGKHDE